MSTLPDLSAMTQEQLIALIQAQREAATRTQRLTFKVSEKGALCVCGLGRFPVTLYISQWERLLDPATLDALKAFAKANASKLARKG